MAAFPLTAEDVAFSPRFDSEPVALYDDLVSNLGDQAAQVWLRACVLYDQYHADDDE